MNDVRILSSGRRYSFRQDHIRLTVITTQPVFNAVQSAFSFQVAAVDTPPSTYGPAEIPAPPGAVFQTGQWQPTDGGPSVAVRELYFEPRRLVVSIAGPSSLLDSLIRQLRDVLEAFNAPDGTPVLSEPIDVRDWSELSAVLDSRSLRRRYGPRGCGRPGQSEAQH